MKKMSLFVVAIAASLNIMALTPTATAVITMTGDVSGNFDKVTLVESTTDGFTALYENGYDVFQPDLNIPGIYAISGANRFSTSMTNNLDNNAIGVITGTDVSYTMSFSSVTGRTLKIFDKVTQIETTLKNSGTYQFSAAASTRLDNRFVINYSRVPDEGELEICHKDNQLQLLNNPYTDNIVVKDANGDIVINEPSTNTPQYIDLSGLAAGQYTVELNNGNRSFIIKK